MNNRLEMHKARTNALDLAFNKGRQINAVINLVFLLFFVVCYSLLVSSNVSWKIFYMLVPIAFIVLRTMAWFLVFVLWEGPTEARIDIQFPSPPPEEL